MTTITKETTIALLDKWIAQRAGLDPADYGIYPGARDIAGARAAYRSESRRITQQGKDARALLRAVENSNITAPELIAAFRAYAGRLSIVETEKGAHLEYCTGQYFPTEYRAAAAAVLASALWEYHRPDVQNAENKGDALRAKFIRIFGKSIARRWFD